MVLEQPVGASGTSSPSQPHERRYLTQRWRVDRSMLRWSSLAAAILNPAGWATDLAIAGWGQISLVLLLGRLAAGASAVALFLSSRSEQPPEDPQHLERICKLGFSLTVLSGVLGPTLLRPTSVAAQGGPLLAIILLYSLFFPVWRKGKMAFFVASGILYVLAGLYVRKHTGYGGKHELITISLFLAAASVMGPSTLARIERLQREIFDARGDLHATIESLRAESAARALQAERLEQARREAAIANEAKSYFLASISHDLRTPIAGVLSTAELLAETPMNGEQKELLEALRGSGRLLLAVVNDILDLSKLEAGKLTIATLPTDVRRIVNDVCALLRHDVKAKGIELRVDIAANLHPLLVTDPVRLQQILFNLVGNAVKFTSVGHVDVRVFLQSTNEGVERLHIEVSDTGIGIAGETLARLFQPFVQAESATARKYGGTGLGLAISKRLAELLGGTIRVESELGRGSTFRIELPAIVGSEQRAASESARAVARHMRILVAEDNEINAMIVTRYLKSFGYEYVRVGDGQAAVDMARNEPFDAILMDMHMPVMDGLDAVRVIRNVDGKRGQIPIIAFTADAIESHRSRYLEAGVDAVLTKPYTRADLSNTLADVTQKRRIA